MMHLYCIIEYKRVRVLEECFEFLLRGCFPSRLLYLCWQIQTLYHIPLERRNSDFENIVLSCHGVMHFLEGSGT